MRNKKMPPLLFACVTLVSLICVNKVNAQRVFNYNLPYDNCHCEMIFEEPGVNPSGVIVLDIGEVDIVEFSQRNAYKDSGLFGAYSFLYIKIKNKGTSDPLECYQAVVNSIALANRIYTSAFYFVVDNSLGKSKVILSQLNLDYNIVYGSEIDLSDLVANLDTLAYSSAYRLPKSVENGYLNYDLRMKNYSNNFDVGVRLNPQGNFGNKLGLDNSVTTFYSLYLAKSLSSRLSVSASVNFSLKKPDVKSLQSSLQSEMMTAIQNDEDSYIIDEKLNGHVMIGTDLSIKYYLNKSKQFRPYLGLSIGMYNLTNMSGSIQDTLDLSDIDMSDPSSMQDQLGDGVSADPGELDQIKSQFIAPAIEPGFEYRIAPSAKVSVAVPFKYYMDKSDSNLSSFSLGIQFGLAFTLNSRKIPDLELK